MGLPSFLLRKLYRKGSLRSVAEGQFAFELHNPLGTATIVAPPDLVVNGIPYRVEDIDSGFDLASITRDAPFMFHKGDRVTLRLHGHLLRGGNRIHVVVLTKEWGELEIFAEDNEADFCETDSSEE